MLDFRINTFLTVCSCMNYTKAAELLHITQPAVSQHIKYLEELYHTTLFIYEGKKLWLSPSGEILFHTAATIKNDEKFLLEQLQSATHDNMPLTFGTTMTISEFVIAKPLAQYIHNHPHSNISVITSNTSDLLKRLRSGEIHFALVEGYFEKEEYDYLVYSTEEFIPICAPAHTFRKEPKFLHELLEERLIIREPGSGTRDILEKNLALHGLSTGNFSNIAELSSMLAIIDLVKADCGISFLYRTAVQKDLANHTLCELTISDFKMSHDFTFIWNKGSIYEAHYRSICNELHG